MTPLFSKMVLGGVGSALLSLGALAAGTPALAANLPAAAGHVRTATTTPAAAATKDQRILIRRAVTDAEADALGLTTEQLRDDLRKGRSIEDIAQAQGMSKAQVVEKTAASLQPRLESLVAAGKITRAQADRTLDRIRKGHLPGWKGDHHHRAATPAAPVPSAPLK